MREPLRQANEFLRENIGKTDDSFRPRYHFTPPIGWMNDPNGVCFFRGEIHIFYQYYPYDSVWGPMHWGHVSSIDPCLFQYYPVALAPDREDETGCFSGGAMVAEGKMTLLYTKHYETATCRKEIQGMAESDDGVHFVKRDKPILLSDEIPMGLSKTEFRDPNPFVLKKGGVGVFAGSQTTDKQGAFLLFTGKDLTSLHYRNVLRSPFFGIMGECPDFFRLDGKDVLIFSAIELKERDCRFRNISSSLYMVGKLDEETGEFKEEYCDEIDCGHDFYAPQTCENDRGERIMTAWMQMWGDEYYTAVHRHGYCGGLIYPRVLSLKEGRLFQRPAAGVEKYRVSAAGKEKISRSADLTFSIDEGGRVALKGENGECFCLEYNSGKLSFALQEKNKTKSKRMTRFTYGKRVTVRLLMDVSCVEGFVDGGRETFTERWYAEAEQLSVECAGAVAEEAYELDIPAQKYEIFGSDQES